MVIKGDTAADQETGPNFVLIPGAVEPQAIFAVKIIYLARKVGL